MDNMDNMNNVNDMNDIEFGTIEKQEITPDYNQQKNGYINIQNVPIKKSRFKRFAPFVATTLISAVIGGVAGGAYVNYYISQNTYTAPITYYSNLNQAKPVDYVPPTSLIARIAEEVGPAIVGISTTGVSQSVFGESVVPSGAGSGIIFDSTGYIVTNQHVIDGGKEITVTLAGGKKFPAQVVGADARSDLAVLKINAGNNNLPAARFGDSDKVRVGDLAVAIGNPLGEYEGSVTSGIISALNRKMNINEGDVERRYSLMQTDAAINPGNSGGALINGNGEIIGINTIKYVDSKVEGIGFAIPINNAKPILEELMKNGYISRAQLGVTITAVTEEMMKSHNFPEGVRIEEVRRGSAAEAAGLRPMDVIVEINGVKVKANEDLISELEKFKPGDSVNLKVWRDGQNLDIPVTLGEQTKQVS